MDFEGSGMSSGDFVSLGWFEKTQVSLVVEHLTDYYHIGALGIWGRSMGAVTGLLYAEENPHRVSALVADSPFSSLKKMVQDIAFEHYKIPAFVVNLGLSVISSSIEERLGVDLFEHLDPYVNCAKCVAPVTFIAASSDGLVQPKRVNQMFKNYGGKHAGVKKQYLECSGNHTDARDDDLVQTCFDFVAREFDLYSEAKSQLDRAIFDMNKYVRVKGVKNGRNSKKVIPVDRKGNIKMACKLSTTKMPNSGMNLMSSRSGQSMNTATLRESTNMQEYKDKISPGISLLRPNLPKSNYNKFKDLNKENSRKISPRVPSKILESDVEATKPPHRKPEHSTPTSPILYAATTRQGPSTEKQPSLLGIKHHRTRSMTGLLSFSEQSSPSVASPSFLGHAANMSSYNSQPRTLGSRHNSFSNLLQDDLNLSAQYTSAKQTTPLKAKASGKESSTVNVNLYASTSRCLKRLEEVCNYKSGSAYTGPHLVNIKGPPLHEARTATTTPNDSHIYNRSDWFQFGFGSKPSYLGDIFGEENRRLETLAKERYAAN